MRQDFFSVSDKAHEDLPCLCVGVRLLAGSSLKAVTFSQFPFLANYQSANIFTMITRKIQEETLRTYLFTFSGVYDSISLDSLATTFELDVPSVHSIVSKMIISEELMVSFTRILIQFLSLLFHNFFSVCLSLSFSPHLPPFLSVCVSVCVCVCVCVYDSVLVCV